MCITKYKNEVAQVAQNANNSMTKFCIQRQLHRKSFNTFCPEKLCMSWTANKRSTLYH